MHIQLRFALHHGILVTYGAQTNQSTAQLFFRRLMHSNNRILHVTYQLLSSFGTYLGSPVELSPQGPSG